MPKQFSNIEYYGKGPHENYIDRAYSQNLGVWNQTVEEQFWGYVRPQETGTKTGVRYWTVTDAEGKGLKFEGTEPLECQALKRKGPIPQRRPCGASIHRPSHCFSLNGHRMRELLGRMASF